MVPMAPSKIRMRSASKALRVLSVAETGVCDMLKGKRVVWMRHYIIGLARLLLGSIAWGWLV